MSLYDPFEAFDGDSLCNECEHLETYSAGMFCPKKGVKIIKGYHRCRQAKIQCYECGGFGFTDEYETDCPDCKGTGYRPTSGE